MNILARLDPGDPVLLTAATSLAIVTLAAIGSEGLVHVSRRLGASGKHDLYLATLLITLLSPTIALGVARSGLALYRFPPANGSPSEVIATAPVIMPHPLPTVERQGQIEVESRASDDGGDVRMPVEPTPTSIPLPKTAIATGMNRERPLEVVALPERGRAWAGALFAMWVVGFAWFSARLARGVFWLFALRRRARPIDVGPIGGVLVDVRRALGDRTLPPIFEASGVRGPLAGGVVRPMVVLPIGMVDSLGAAGLRDILIHECAHVARRDTLVGLLQRIAEAIFWPHPLVHRLNGRLARTREEACDDVVLRSGDACGYARTLLMLAERGGSSVVTGAVVGLFETRWRLADRVTGILDRGREPKMKTSRWLNVASVAVLALASVAVAAIRPGDPTRVDAQAPAAFPDERVGSVIEGQVVDEAGAPVADASVNVIWFRRAKEDARTAADGRFTLKIPGPVRPAGFVRASSVDGSRIGTTRREEPRGARPEPVRIVLKPSRDVTVRVEDAAGKAVEGAAVEVQCLSAGPIERGTTDATGMARFRLPADVDVDTVAALKEGIGFDYFENYRSWPSTRRDPLPAELALVLDGAVAASVRAVDSQGGSIAGVEFHPTMIQKPGKLAGLNGSGSDIVQATTGPDGIARFGWLPRSGADRIYLSERPWDYHCPVQPILKVGDVVIAQVLRAVRLAGKVTNTDGSSAAGVLIQAESQGKANGYGRRLARTGADGSYAVTMPPDQLAMIAVVDPTRAARALTGIVIREGRPRDDLDIRLVEGARFVARITDEATGKPLPGFQLTIQYRGGEVSEEFRGINTSGDRQALYVWSKADAGGRVEFRLGPGDYAIVGHENLHVDGPGEISRDYHEAADRAESGVKPLNGLVALAGGEPGRPVGGALVRFVTPPRRRGRDIEAVADAVGRFQVEPLIVEGGLVMAKDRDGKVAGYRFVEKAGEEVKVTLDTATTASGRVVESSGKPVVGRRVQLSISVPVTPESTFRTFDFTTTDAQGLYLFAGLIPGTRCEALINHQDGENHSNRVSVEKFTVNGPDPITIPDVTIPGQPESLPQAAAGPKFLATEVAGANFMPYGITRAEVEDLVKAIGREPATAEVIAEVSRIVRPQENWITELGPLRRAATDPKFVTLADKASLAVLGQPARTATLAYLANFSGRSKTEAELRALLAYWRTLKPGTPVRGVVEDRVTSKPVSGAVVFNAVGLTTTDAKGEFTLAASSRGNLWVESEGYALAEAFSSGGPVKVALVAEVPIIGRVLEREGFKPVEGAVVWAMAKHSLFLSGAERGNNDNYGFPLTARTDSLGRFAFRGLPPGVKLDWFEVQHPQFYLASRGVMSLKADLARDLLVRVGCVVSGEIVDEIGRGVAGASVGIRPSGDSMVRHSIVTEGDGRYRFGNLAPGRYDLIVEPERLAFRTIAVVAEPNRPAINQVVVEAGWRIFGKVVDPEGRPIKDAAVGWPTPIDASGTADLSHSLNRISHTEADGTFQIIGLAPGKYRLRAMVGSPPRRAEVDASVNQADLVITIPGVGK